MTDGTFNNPPVNPEQPPAGNPYGQPSDSYPHVPAYAQAAVPKKSKGKFIVIGVVAFFGLISLCGIGAFAFKAFTGKSSGASSPDGVITSTLSSLEKQDLLGAVRQADPHEVEPFIESYEVFLDELEDSGEIGEADKPLEAFSFKVENLETKTEMYSDDVARVEILSGKITQRVDKSKLPKKVRDNYESREVIDIDDANEMWQEGDEEIFDAYSIDADKFNPDDLESEHIFYIAVKRDGRWYFSSMYTLAEYIRITSNALGGDYDRPSFDKNDRIAKGSDTPEKATRTFIEELVGLDSKGLIESTAPERFSVAHDYKGLLTKAESRNEDNPYWLAAKDAVSVTDIETTSEKEGDDRYFVAVKAIDIAVEYSLDPKNSEKDVYQYLPYEAQIDASWDGKCFAAEGTYRVYEATPTQFGAVSFPVTDAQGTAYTREDAEDSSFDMEFPVRDASGKIFPDLYIFNDSTVYHPVPWYDADGNEIYDKDGNEVISEDDLYGIDDDFSDEDFDDEDLDDYFADLGYPYKDANGEIVYDEDGDMLESEQEMTYDSVRSNVDEKECLSTKEMKDFPEIGLVTIKEDSKYYVSPLDTMWHYILEALEKSDD